MDRRVKQSIEVEAPVSRVYEYWSNLENLPRFMKNVEEVCSTGPDTTHWVVNGPLGYRVEFDARTTRDEPNEAIGWNTLDGDVQTSGQVRFEEVAPGRTKVEVTMDVAGDVSDDAEGLLGTDLERFAEVVEGSDPAAWAGRERSRRASRGDAPPSDPAGTDFDGALLLLESWEADESSDDEEALAELKEALDRDRPSYRKLFPDG